MSLGRISTSDHDIKVMYPCRLQMTFTGKVCMLMWNNFASVATEQSYIPYCDEGFFRTFRRLGWPKIVQSDQGREFVNEVNTHLFQLTDIKPYIDTSFLEVHSIFQSTSKELTEDMIACDECDEWFHYDCVGIKDDSNLPQKWYCSTQVKTLNS